MQGVTYTPIKLAILIGHGRRHNNAEFVGRPEVGAQRTRGLSHEIFRMINTGQYAESNKVTEKI